MTYGIPLWAYVAWANMYKMCLKQNTKNHSKCTILPTSATAKCIEKWKLKRSKNSSEQLQWNAWRKQNTRKYTHQASCELQPNISAYQTIVWDGRRDHDWLFKTINTTSWKGKGITKSKIITKRNTIRSYRLNRNSST